jgi:hypothetical protein
VHTVEVQPGAPVDPRYAEAAKKARQLGYHVETRDNRKYYCRTVTPLGSHLSSKECMSWDSMVDLVRNSNQQQQDFFQPRGCTGSQCVTK